MAGRRADRDERRVAWLRDRVHRHAADPVRHFGYAADWVRSEAAANPDRRDALLRRAAAALIRVIDETKKETAA